jgi:pyruvate kinase
MLESMTHNPRPTRAEASDVANAILDGSDAVMLSGETSIGEYPIQAVKAMANIAEFTEKNLHDYLTAGREFGSEQLTVTDAIGQATCEVAKQVGAKLIIPLTLSGYSARMIARHRPEIPMFAVTVNPHTQRRLALVWGAQAALIEQDLETDQVVHAAMGAARQSGLVQRGDRVVITAGVPTGVTGKTNMIQVREIE